MKNESDREVFLKHTLDYIPEAVFLKDMEGHYLFCNRAFENIFGIKKDEILGKKDDDIEPLKGLFQKENRCEGALFGVGEEADREIYSVVLRGVPKTVSVKKNRVLDNEGNLIGTVGLISDITEEKRRGQDLVDALDRMKSIDKAKSEFFASMSHEIRTPLNAIIGMASLLVETELTKDQRELIEISKSSAEALLLIINDILDFSKIEAGKIDFEHIDFDLRVTIEHTLDTLGIKAQEKGIELNCMINHDVPSLLKGDPGRLRQVLLNIIGNAIKFTDRGEVFVNISLEHEDENDARIRFSVADTGMGIPKDKIDRLFQPFSQIDMPSRRKNGGTGLGLFISKRLVEKMEGDIWVESEEGKGTTVTFNANFEKQSISHHIETISPVETKLYRVLIVNENKTNALVLGRMLEAWGFRYMITQTPKDAIDALFKALNEKDPFAIAILDRHMVDIDGEKLGIIIKSDERLKNTALIMLSGLGKRGDANRLKELGFSAFLTKPIKGSQLLECLISIIHQDERGVEKGKILTRFTIEERKKRNIRILVAEDNPANQKIFSLILNKLGYCADISGNGKEAFALYEKNRYDLILMDVQMPVMNGFEATRLIRAKEANSGRHVPIIAITAGALSEDRNACFDAGMDEYISKPVVPERIIEVIERVLSNRVSSLDKEEEIDRGIFDKNLLMRRLDINETLVKEIMEVYLSDTPTQISRLKGYVEKGDLLSVQRCAHSIKGASLNFCAGRMYDVALELESSARQGDMEAIRRLMFKIEDEFEVLKETLKKAD